MSPQNPDNLGMHLGLKEIDTFLIHLMWSFNFSLDFEPSPLYKTVGAFYSGMDASGTGVQQMLLSKSVIRYQMLHYANQFAHYEMVTFINCKSYFSFLKLLQPFDLATWLAIIISSSLVTFILFCTLQQHKQNVFGLTSVALWILSVTMFQSFESKAIREARQRGLIWLLIIGWLFATYLLGNEYTGSLYSSLAKANPPSNYPKSVEEILNTSIPFVTTAYHLHGNPRQMHSTLKDSILHDLVLHYNKQYKVLNEFKRRFVFFKGTMNIIGEKLSYG